MTRALLAACAAVAALTVPAAAGPTAGAEVTDGPGVCVWWDVSPPGPVIAGRHCVS